MIWLAWRQLRAQVLVVGGVLVALAIALLLTGPHLVHLYDTTVGTCAAHGDCNAVQSTFMLHDKLLRQLGVVVLLMPALIGMFWGAPLVARELEHRTHHLVWTQSVSRTRWLATKVGLVGLASVAVAGLFSLMVTWWSSPFDRITDTPFSPSFFDRRDIVPVAYAAFAFALGTTAGIVIRRTLPAMATTLVAYLGVRFAVVNWIRPHFMSPLKAITPFSPFGGNGPGGGLNPADWVVSDTVINRAGQVIGQNGGIGPNGDIGFGVSSNGKLTLAGVGPCPNRAPAGLGGGGRNGPPSPAVTHAFNVCTQKLGIREVLSYQPIGRFWPFQWFETGIFIALALALAAFCLWWVRTRLA